jgi:hypothetical protein
MVRHYGKHQQNQRAKAARDHASSILNFLNPRQGEEETKETETETPTPPTESHADLDDTNTGATTAEATSDSNVNDTAYDDADDAPIDDCADEDAGDGNVSIVYFYYVLCLIQIIIFITHKIIFQ